MATSPPHPAPPHASPASQQYSSPSNTASSRLNSQLPHVAYGQQQAYSSGYAPHHPNHPSYPYKYNPHQRAYASSSRSSGSCSSSARNYYPPCIPEQAIAHHATQDPRSNRFSQDMRHPDPRVHLDESSITHSASEKEHDQFPVTINESGSPDEMYGSSPNRNPIDRPMVAPKPSIKTNNLEQLQNNIRNRNHNNHVSNVLKNQQPCSPLNNKGSQRGKLSSTDSDKVNEFARKRTTSFDSGLPGEEVDLVQESAPNSYVENGTTNNSCNIKTPLLVLPSSSSSSVSGSTAVTAESRLTS